MGSSPSTRRRNLDQSDVKDSAHEKNQDSDNEDKPDADTAKHESLNICTVQSRDPLVLFQKWYEEAQSSDEIALANSATLSTASRTGRTSSRIVGVRTFDRNGFKIATNFNSLKAKNLEENPHASLHYDWGDMCRMVRIDGRVTKLPDDAMNSIWKGFSRSAQILNTASHQDEAIKCSQEILDRKEELEKKYGASTAIPRDPAWCAYILIPEVWEFDQIRPAFMDRLVFRRTRPGERPDEVILHEGREGWVIETLSP